MVYNIYNKSLSIIPFWTLCPQYILCLGQQTNVVSDPNTASGSDNGFYLWGLYIKDVMHRGGGGWVPQKVTYAPKSTVNTSSKKFEENLESARFFVVNTRNTQCRETMFFFWLKSRLTHVCWNSFFTCRFFEKNIFCRAKFVPLRYVRKGVPGG